MRANIGIVALFLAFAGTLPAQTAEMSEYARVLRDAQRSLAEGDYNGVIGALKGWPARQPQRPEADHFLGLAYYRLADYSSAIRHLSAALEREAEATAPWKQTVEILGAALYFANQWQQAVPLLEKAAAWQPENADLHYTLAMSHVFTGNTGGARRAFAKVFHVEPDSPQAYVLTADLMRKEGVETGAEALLNEARRKWPEFSGLATRLGTAAMNRGDPARAVELFREEVRSNPADSGSWHALAEALVGLGQTSEAVEALKRAIWLDARATPFYILLARQYMDAGNYTIAESTLQQALKANPQSYEANFLLGRLYHKTGRAEMAKKQLAIADQIPH
jgi:tetratricopeptide (TPR) repeat protein